MCKCLHNAKYVQYGNMYECHNKRNYCINESVLKADSDIELERRLNAVYNFVEQKNYFEINGYRYDWIFYYHPSVQEENNPCMINVWQLMKEYPSDVGERIDRILINLSREYPLLSNVVKLEEFIKEKFRMIYCESDDRLMEASAVFSALMRKNYIEVASREGDESVEYRITLDGWDKIKTLINKNEISKQGFIAMSFSPSVAYIEKIFKEAIIETGYKPQIIKDKQHNNYIKPEIFYEIKNSKFVVVDVTEQNYGAYYEAGYAQALGKEVIVCCRKEIFDNHDTKPHFDIAQKSMILWVTEDDLKTRLINRIKATVS